MFKRLLVPLDGSKMAEAVLPVAAWLSLKLSAKVTLIHVIEQDAPEEIHGERHLTFEEDACKYLDQIASGHFPEGVAECHVHAEKVQDVARSIADHSSEMEPDLIIMCTHGESGLHDIMVGSIAQQVIGRERAPILLIHPEQTIAETQGIRKILVALDQEPEHDSAVPVAAELAEKLGAGLSLLTVVPTLGTLSGERAASGWLLPGATRAMLDMDQESADAYLAKVAAQWRKPGLPIATQVLRGEPVQQILAGAGEVGADLIALATHGKSGMSAFWSSSVAPKVVTSTHLPLLLIPVRK